MQEVLSLKQVYLMSKSMFVQLLIKSLFNSEAFFQSREISPRLPSAGAHTQSPGRASSYSSGQRSEDTHIAAAAAILNLSTRCREAADILANRQQGLHAKVGRPRARRGASGSP